MTSPDDLARTRHAYDTVARDYAALLPGLDAETALDVAMIDDLARRCLASGLGPVADVGCGTGRVSAHLADHGLDVAGFDLSPGMVEQARIAHPRLPFTVAAVHELPVADAAFGGVLAWYSLIHTSPAELVPALQELARVLVPGGHLLTAFQAGAGERVERSHGYGHEVAFVNHRHDPGLVAELLQRTGFDLQVQLRRASEGRERTPQAFLLATRRP